MTTKSGVELVAADHGRAKVQFHGLSSGRINPQCAARRALQMALTAYACRTSLRLLSCRHSTRLISVPKRRHYVQKVQPGASRQTRGGSKAGRATRQTAEE